MNRKNIAISILLIALFCTTAFAASQKRFSDVEEDDWFYSSVEELSQDEIIKGYEDGTFKPGNNINRAEASVMLYLLKKQIYNKIAELDADINIKLKEVNKKIEELEAKEGLLGDIEEEEEDNTENEVKENAESEIEKDNTENEEKNTKEIEVDLEIQKGQIDDFETYTDSAMDFKLQYPKIYFWNMYGESKKELGYNWYVAFGEEDFNELEEDKMEENTEMSVAIINTNENINSDKEVKIFVKKDDETSFLIEGNSEDIENLEKVARSLEIISEE